MATRKILVCRGVCLLLFCATSVRSEDNISVRKTAAQSSDFGNRWDADAAVDGCVNQDIRSSCCSHTQAHEEAWWRVNLGTISTISYITIYYRDERSHNFDSKNRLAGYQLYLSNTTDWTQGVLCYEDTSSTSADVKLVVTHQCPYVAQYVTVYNYRSNPKRHDWYDDYAVLELCEVQVFGCPIRKHGNGSCIPTCSETCYGGNCDASTGSCFYCPPTMHGNSCDLACSSFCKDRLCDKDSGYCKACNTGRYGDVCAFTCPVACKDCMCDQQTGQCLDCYPGKYGVVCGADCPATCKDSVCDKDTGHCLITAEVSEDDTDYKLIILAVICGLSLIAIIILIVCLLRKNKKKDESSDNNPEPCDPDPNYTCLSSVQEGTPNMYEMTVT